MKKLLILLLIAQMSFADCPKSLQACEEVVQAQDQAIDNLKNHVIVLKRELEQEKNHVPSWVFIVGGMALGVILNSSLRK